jgi:hypothetical protein
MTRFGSLILEATYEMTTLQTKLERMLISSCRRVYNVTQRQRDKDHIQLSFQPFNRNITL